MKTDAQLLKLNAQAALVSWYKPRLPSHKCPNHVALHRFAASHIGAEANIQYLEFGVHKGASMKRALSLFTNKNAAFTGFDSFEGLPERWLTMRAGHFSTGGEPPPLRDPRLHFRKGWFQNTVPAFLPGLERDPAQVTLVHFDADLYSSTLFLLTSLWWHIREYFFIFDEFFGEELIAMTDFMSAYPIEVELFACVETGVGMPIQVFGKLRNIPMVVEGSAPQKQAAGSGLGDPEPAG